MKILMYSPIVLLKGEKNYYSRGEWFTEKITIDKTVYGEIVAWDEKIIEVPTNPSTLNLRVVSV